MSDLRLSLIALALLPLAVACGDDDDPAGAGDSFSASLSGGEEVPPVTTTATGTATFDIVGDQISYTVGTPAITFDELVEAMRAGNAYVNVHTHSWRPDQLYGQCYQPDERCGLSHSHCTRR
jgi:hypothetical protein